MECALGVWWRTAVAPVSRAIPACTWRVHPPLAKTADDAPLAHYFVSLPLCLSASGLFWYKIFALYEHPVCIYKITSSVRVIALPYDIFYAICHLLQTEDSVFEPVREHSQSMMGANVSVFVVYSCAQVYKQESWLSGRGQNMSPLLPWREAINWFISWPYDRAPAYTFLSGHCRSSRAAWDACMKHKHTRLHRHTHTHAHTPCMHIYCLIKKMSRQFSCFRNVIIAHWLVNFVQYPSV